jgi:hypothetical protein
MSRAIGLAVIAALALMLPSGSPANAASLTLTLQPNSPVDIAYTGPSDASYTTTFDASSPGVDFSELEAVDAVSTNSGFAGFDFEGMTSNSPGPGCCTFATHFGQGVPSDFSVSAQSFMAFCLAYQPGSTACNGFILPASVTLTISISDPNSADLFVVTPIPAALPLFATGLGALGLFGWRRKRKNAAVQTALASAKRPANHGGLLDAADSEPA